MFAIYKKSTAQQGQAGLVILLLTVVLLTLGISVASRSTTDVTISRQEEESNRVFNAAETGIEAALSQDLENISYGPDGIFTGSSSDVDDIAINYQIERVNILETRLFQGVSAQVDVDAAKAGGEGLEISWSKQYDCGAASLLVTIFSDNAGTVTARSLAYKPCSTPNNGFTHISAGGTGFYREVTVPLQPDDVFVRIKPLYNDTHILVEGVNWNLPDQYYRVKSVAENQAGDEVRTVEVNRTKPVAPSVMDFVLFSGDTLSK